jgi:hypothetical protein
VTPRTPCVAGAFEATAKISGFHSLWIYTMHRCVLAAALAACALAGPVAAQPVQGRHFPATALRGQLQFLMPPLVQVNGAPARLAPGARIRGTDNLLILSGTLVGQTTIADYTIDPLGQLHDVWLLSPDEAAKQPWPTTPQQAAQWHFDPNTQTWSRP